MHRILLNLPYTVYNQNDTKQQHIYGFDSISATFNAEKLSRSTDQPIDSIQPGISADGHYIVYLDRSRYDTKTCTQNLLDREDCRYPFRFL